MGTAYPEGVTPPPGESGAGNRKTIAVGTRTLMCNTYASKNGQLTQQTYGNGDTGFYYLQSRYYDPAIGRFINADSFTSTGQDFLGYNMFAYCGNNPIL